MGSQSVAVLIVALALVACGGGDAPPAATSDSPATEEDDYEAPPLEIPADCPKVSSDKGVLNLVHNFSIYGDSAALDRLFYEEPVKVGKDRTFEVPALTAGPYLFRCDLHANQMEGILVVE